MQYLPGTVVTILNADFKPAGDGEVQLYLHQEKAYKVWWTYPQTSERELIKVPEWKLVKKVVAPPKYIP